MAEPDVIRLLSTTRWGDVAACLIRHEAELLRVDDDAVDRLAAEAPSGPTRPGYPTPIDVWVLLRLIRDGDLGWALHHVTFVQSSDAVAHATSAEDREDLLTEALISGLIVTDALQSAVVLDQLVALAEVAEALDRPSTQLMALVATVRSTAFALTGDVAHADRSIDAFRTVVAPPDGLGPLHDSGLTGARAALALVLAARDRATTGPDSGHDDLLEAIAIARASATLDPPLQEEDELAANTLLTLLAELYQVTGHVVVVDDALDILDRLSDRPPTVGQLAARVLWLRLRYESSRDVDDLTRALLSVDDALTRAVTDTPDPPTSAADSDGGGIDGAGAVVSPTGGGHDDLDWLRDARRHILLALSDLRKRPGDPPT